MIQSLEGRSSDVDLGCSLCVHVAVVPFCQLHAQLDSSFDRLFWPQKVGNSENQWHRATFFLAHTEFVVDPFRVASESAAGH